MAQRDPEKMQSIRRYVDSYFGQFHQSPSIREIERGTGINRATVQRYLVYMDQQGMLEYSGSQKSIVTSTTRKLSGNSAAPVVGVIPCGTPEDEEEHAETYVNLPEALFGKGEFFILRASGDSMTDAGIEENDLIVLKKQTEARAGDIVAALDEYGGSTLKKYGGIDPESHSAVLLYQNQEKYPDKRILVKELRVQGVATHLIKALY